MRPIGRHVIAEFTGVSKAKLHLHPSIESWVYAAAHEAGLHPEHCQISERKTKDDTDGRIVGYTICCALNDGHLNVHTYSDYGTVLVDCYTYGNGEPEQAIAHLQSYYRPLGTQVETLQRGRRENAR